MCQLVLKLGSVKVASLRLSNKIASSRSALPQCIIKHINSTAGCETQKLNVRVMCEGANSGAENPRFGYNRKDVLLIGVGLILIGYGLYYGLQSIGVEPGMAGNWVQLVVFLGISVCWVSTYLYRVATKSTTYFQ